MMKIEFYDINEVAAVSPADTKDVEHVLSQPESGGNGRSNWVWMRLNNGDLILGVFPQGDTYIEITDRLEV